MRCCLELNLDGNTSDLELMSDVDQPLEAYHLEEQQRSILP